tara:strand:- start:37 stop:471 length:435 start_codon:yes stop_codon:yes gene_type:complete
MRNILFVCTGNSARSILAEALINKNYSLKFKAFSAGSNPTGKINPNIKKYLEKKNFDISNYSSKNFDQFLNNKIKIHQVITVCNNAHNEICPVWPEKKDIIHWDIEDPVEKIKSATSDIEIEKVIDETYEILSNKIKEWVANEE